MAEAEEKSVYEQIAEQRKRELGITPSVSPPAPAPESAAPLAPTDIPSPVERQARDEEEPYSAPTIAPVGISDEAPPDPYRRKRGEQIAPEWNPRETPAGPVYSPYWSPTGARRMSKTKDVNEKYRLAQQTLPEEAGKLVSPDDMDLMADPEPLGSIFSMLHTIDLPRTAAWLGAYATEGFLPDPTVEGSEATTVSRMGDAAQWATGKLAGLALDVMFKAPEAEEGEVEAFEQIGENLYNAFATGELLEKGLQRRVNMYSSKGKLGIPFVDLIGEEGLNVPYPKGVDFLDSVVPIDVARKIAAAQPAMTASTIGPSFVPKWNWDILSSRAGREWYGLGLEVAADPLWFLGPASATARIVSKSGHTYEIGKPLVKAAGVIQDVTPKNKIDIYRAITDTVDGTAKEKKAAEALFKLSDELIAQKVAAATLKEARYSKGLKDPAKTARAAKEAADDSARRLEDMIADFEVKNLTKSVTAARKAHADLAAEAAKFGTNTKAAKTYLKKQAEFATKEVAALKRQQDTLIRGRKMLNDGIKGGFIKEKGTFAVHVPFGTKTSYLLPPGRRVKQVMPEPLITKTGKVVDWMKPPSKQSLDDIVEKSGIEGLNGAQKVALSLYKTAEATQTHVLKYPLWFYGGLGKAFGTRHHQALLGRFRTGAEIAQHAPRRGLMATAFTMPRWLGGGEYIVAKKVAPELWDATQDAITQYNRRIMELEGFALERIDRIVAEAATVAKTRKAEASAELGEALSNRNRLIAWDRNATGVEKARLQTLLDNAEDRVSRYQQWQDRGYTPQTVIMEAMNEYESGARFAKLHPEHVRAHEGVEKLIHEIFHDFRAELGDDIDRVRQALFNLQSKMMGSVEHHARIRKEMDVIGEAFVEHKRNQVLL